MEEIKIELSHKRYDFKQINDNLNNRATIQEKLAYLLEFKAKIEQNLTDSIKTDREAFLENMYAKKYKEYLEDPYYIHQNPLDRNSFGEYAELKHIRERWEDIIKILNTEINKIENWIRINAYSSSLNQEDQTIVRTPTLKDVFCSVKDKIEIMNKLEKTLYNRNPLIIGAKSGYLINFSGKGQILFLVALKEKLKNKGLLNNNDPKKLRNAFYNEFNIPINDPNSRAKQFEDNYAKNEDLNKYYRMLTCIS